MHSFISCRFQSAALGLAVVALIALPAIAKEDGTAAPAIAAPSTAAAPTPPTLPSISYHGGTAIINFVAPVTSKTMADLAQSAQNATIGGADRLRINISSRGGSLHAIQFAVNVLKNLPIPVETVAMSQIASAAVALYCAGEARYMAEGAALYLHQQRGFEEIQLKTAGAVVRELELSTEWYNTVLRDCADEKADPAMLDYTSRDLVIDTDQAEALGMTTAPMSALDHKSIWGTSTNVIAPDEGNSMYPYPGYR